MAVTVPTTQALEAPDAPALASACFGCHGFRGRSSGAIPDLAGMSAAVFRQRMKGFRGGEGTVMRYIVPAYSEADVKALAAYFASLAPTP